MHTKHRNWRERIRFNKESIQPFLEQKTRLRQMMVRYRARGDVCRLDRGESAMGPGLLFKDGSILKLTFAPRNRMLRRRAELKPRKSPYPFLVMYQGLYLKLLKAPGRRREF
jgi:hypothetical protein